MKVSVNAMAVFGFNLVLVVNKTPPCPESDFKLYTFTSK